LTYRYMFLSLFDNDYSPEMKTGEFW
jgi:hypothetical protein